MKVIDLLNKIANGEEVPKKIIFRKNIYVWFKRYNNVFNYAQECNGRLIDNYFCDDWFVDSNDILNDEVEIIEENNKIEKFPSDCFADDLNKNEEFFIQNINQLKDKVNEIIDEVNKLKDDRK